MPEDDDEQYYPTPEYYPVAPARQPIREPNGEDLSDLFNVSSEDVLGDTAEGMNDLTDVSENDVFGDGGEDMSDMLDVSWNDVMGEDETVPMPGQTPRYRITPRGALTARVYSQQPTIVQPRL